MKKSRVKTELLQKVHDLPCTKCGGDAPKYARRRKVMKTGRRGSRLKKRTVATYCIICHREDHKTREARHYSNKLAYNRTWRKKNRKLVNGYNKKWYRKNKYDPFQIHVEWFKATRFDGFSSMKYR